VLSVGSMSATASTSACASSGSPARLRSSSAASPQLDPSYAINNLIRWFMMCQSPEITETLVAQPLMRRLGQMRRALRGARRAAIRRTLPRPVRLPQYLTMERAFSPYLHNRLIPGAALQAGIASRFGAQLQ